MPKVFVYYDIIEGLVDEEEDQLPPTEEDLFAIGIIYLPGDLVGANSEGIDLSFYPKHFSTYIEGDIVVDKILVKKKMQNMHIVA